MKERFRPFIRQEILFYFRPSFLMLLFILLWNSVVPWGGRAFYKNRALIFFCCLAVISYAIIISGWRRTRPYSKVGRLRGILQRLSYEVAFILVFLWVFSFLSGFSFTSLKLITIEFSVMWIFLVVLLVLIEGNRAPFDLLEGERELIRGFNIEIGRLIFVYLFLREYGIILVMAAITRIILFIYFNILVFLWLVRIILIFRRCYPRIRYDSLIGLIWKRILPFSTIFLSFLPFIK